MASKELRRKSYYIVHIKGRVWQYKVGKTYIVIYSPWGKKYLTDHSKVTGRTWQDIEKSYYKNHYMFDYDRNHDFEKITPIHCITPSVIKEYIIKNYESSTR